MLRIKIGKRGFVFKYFENDEFRREIEIYDVLNSLKIETIKVFAMTEKSILMEDITASDTLRLGKKEDLSDPIIAKALAKWYRNLHFAGYGYIEENGKDFYCENSVITKENLDFVKKKTKTENLSVWEIIEDNFEKIKSAIESERYTFNYNDFYYTNLVVAKDKSKAFMFDYNIFGKGTAASDINNVCWSLSKESGDAFKAEYGEINEREKISKTLQRFFLPCFLPVKRMNFPIGEKNFLMNFVPRIISKN